MAGVFFAIPQFLISNFHGPWLVDVVAAVISMAALIAFSLSGVPSASGASSTRVNARPAALTGTAGRWSQELGYPGWF